MFKSGNVCTYLTATRVKAPAKRMDAKSKIDFLNILKFKEICKIFRINDADGQCVGRLNGSCAGRPVKG